MALRRNAARLVAVSIGELIPVLPLLIGIKLYHRAPGAVWLLVYYHLPPVIAMKGEERGAFF